MLKHKKHTGSDNTALTLPEPLFYKYLQYMGQTVKVTTISGKQRIGKLITLNCIKRRIELHTNKVNSDGEVLSWSIPYKNIKSITVIVGLAVYGKVKNKHKIKNKNNNWF